MAEQQAACVVIDIDGVVADVRHRLHFLDRKPKNWQGFFAAAKNDGVLQVGADFARTASASHLVVYLTGRPERLRTTTMAWLAGHGLPEGTLLMRRDGDHRPAVMVKLSHLRRLRHDVAVDLVVDDDPQVIDAAGEAGFAVWLAGWMPRDADNSVLHMAQERDGQT